MHFKVKALLRSVVRSSDAEDRGNPMVSGFQDELDPDDTEPSIPQPGSLLFSEGVTVTSDEEEEVPAAPPPVTHSKDVDSEPELKTYVPFFGGIFLVVLCIRDLCNHSAAISTVLTSGIFINCNSCFRPVIHITEPKVPSKVIEPKTRSEAGVQLVHNPGKTKANTPGAEDSDTDHEAPFAQQMLSFVMDDPDFESEASDTPQITKVSQNRIRGILFNVLKSSKLCLW